MPLPNARIPELPPMASLPSGAEAAVYNPVTGVTERFDLSTLSTSVSADARWISTFAYSQGEIVTYDGKLWESLVPGTSSNTGNVPIEGLGFWTERSKSKSGLTMYTPGVFTETDIFVLNTLDGYVQLFRLTTATRPYSSTNFASEYSDGIWELASERGYFIVNKPSHGFTVNKALTFKAGAWNTFTTNDKVLAIVKLVINANNVLVYLTGDRIKSLSGLTAGLVYYAQSDGSISNTMSMAQVFLAISTTEAIALPASIGGGGSTTDRRNHYIFQSNLFTEDAISYRGVISSISVYITSQLLSVSYEVRLDGSPTWASINNLTALQSWINANITGTEASGTLYWIRVLANYNTGAIGEAEVVLSYTAS